MQISLHRIYYISKVRLYGTIDEANNIFYRNLLFPLRSDIMY